MLTIHITNTTGQESGGRFLAAYAHAGSSSRVCPARRSTSWPFFSVHRAARVPERRSSPEHLEQFGAVHDLDRPAPFAHLSSSGRVRAPRSVPAEITGTDNFHRATVLRS